MNYPKLIDIYRKRIELNAPSWREAGLTLCPDKIQSEDFNSEGGSRGPFANNCHLLWMLDEMNGMLIDGGAHPYAEGGVTELDRKLNRWLGFIQGVLWQMGVVSIEDLRQDVLACK